MTPTHKYFVLLVFTGAMLASYPVFKVEGQGNERTLQATDPKDNQYTGQSAGRHETARVFRVSAYCADCTECCGEYAAVPVVSGKRRTASGYRLKPDGSDAGRIVAAPRSVPFGTRFNIPGVGIVTTEDRGGSIREAGDTVAGKVLKYPRLDLLMSSHNEARQFGIKYLKVQVVED